MGKLTELEQWEDDIYQIETSDPVLGGPDGVTNKPARQLSNRTQWLKAQLAAANKALGVHERSRNHPDATLTEKGFTKLYSGVISLDETMAATPKAVKIAMDNANARLAKDRNGADIPNVALFRQNIELGNSATRNVGTTINTVAAGDDPRFSSSVQKANNLSDLTDSAAAVENLGLTEWVKKVDDTQIKLASCVPNTRMVNGHILDADINITSPDIFNDQAIPLGDLNLDTITTPGIYYQDDDRKASLALNYPVAAKGTLIVLKGYNFRSGLNGKLMCHPIQIFYPYTMQRGSPTYSRRVPPDGKTFGGWAQDYNTLNPPTAGAVGAYSKAESYNQTQINQILTTYVPYGRSINGKLLIRDIMLTAADVGAVPTARTINGKSLLTNIILTAGDLGITIPKNTALIDVNGWWKCGDTGLIIQWGIASGADGTRNYPLPTQFPNKGLWAFGYVAAAMPYTNDAISGSAGLLGTAPNTTIRVTTDNNTPTAWLAIGY